MNHVRTFLSFLASWQLLTVVTYWCSYELNKARYPDGQLYRNMGPGFGLVVYYGLFCAILHAGVAAGNVTAPGGPPRYPTKASVLAAVLAQLLIYTSLWTGGKITEEPSGYLLTVLLFAVPVIATMVAGWIVRRMRRLRTSSVSS